MDSTGSKGPGLHEFLIEAELQHYFNAIKTDLKVQNTAQLKYVTEEDLYQLGMSKPEVRRLKKYFNKYYPQNYLSKFKKMLLSKKDDQVRLFDNGMSTGGFGAIAEDHTVDKPPVRIPNKHIISAESIVVNKELGMGEFGVVQQGVWTNDGDRIQVAIKCLSRERMQSNPIEFLKEAAIMHSIDHENVVRLYGVVLDTDSLMLVTELAPLRSLLECLKEPSLRASFPVLTLCDFTLQICDGMQYLEAKRLIHRDLAARNILVFSKNKVKISDFGLSRALGQGKDYYQTNFNVHLKLPIAWCAPECISYLRFTSASDVWAYGVTLWEMFSYGFQPWAALTGHQILEAIDEPNYQRLEQPECCPKEYYSLMLKCWQHEPNKRPRFCEIINVLPECRPEQVQAVMASFECQDEPSVPKRDLLQYRIGDIFTVLDKGSNNSLWKGVLANGKTGLFNPAHTVAYIGTNLPTANKPDAFSRTDTKYSSRRKLRTEMISSPQGDFKHTGHVGLDGAYFGDLSFLGGNNSSQYSHLPRQVVTPYKPHEDMDQLPLLTNNATSGNGMSASSTQLGISTPDTPTSTNLHASDHIALSSRQLQHFGTGPVMEQMNGANNNINRSVRWQNQIEPLVQGDHEYHEISDEENLVNESPRFEKTFDFGPSLLDEMEVMFRNLNSPTPTTPNSPLDHDGVNKCNELRELTSRLSSVTHSSKGKKQATVKPISAADQKTLESAIALANEMTARSMNDLESEPAPTTPASPNKRKFSFRFPSGGGNSDADNSKTERRNFSEEAQSIPDLQQRLRSSLTSLDDSPCSSLRLPLWDRASAEFCFAKSRELLTKPFLTDSKPVELDKDDATLKRNEPRVSQFNGKGEYGAHRSDNFKLDKLKFRNNDASQVKRNNFDASQPTAPHNSFRDLNSATNNAFEPEKNDFIVDLNEFANENVDKKIFYEQKTLQKKLLDLVIDEDNHSKVAPPNIDTNPFRNGSLSYRDRTLTKSDSLSRKTYNSNYVFSPEYSERGFVPYGHETGKYMQLPLKSPSYWYEESNVRNAAAYPPNDFFSPEMYGHWETIGRYGSLYFDQHYNNCSDRFDHSVETDTFLEHGLEKDGTLVHRPAGNEFYYRQAVDTSPGSIRPRALSLSETHNAHRSVKKPTGKTVRERNLRRQSYNPQVYESSSSDSECTSAGSVTHSDMELRCRGRRRRSTLSRLSTSNSSIRSDLLPQTARHMSDLYQLDEQFVHSKPKSGGFRNMFAGRSNKNAHKNVDLALKNVQKNLATADMQFLRPDSGFKSMSKSPPPCSSVLSGLSPTTAARWQGMSDTSSDSSL